ncbi:MAG TPA: DUF3341 domain-containing protein [Candidatus Omnitrophota bacterium]|nr:DUF3341 domain-containing protein [Candidatus Omnitrophota bacterium]
MQTNTDENKLYGLIAEFDTPKELTVATKKAYESGYRTMEAYSPFPIHHLHEHLGIKKTRIPLAVLIGGITGTSTGLLMQYWSCVVNYPLNIGGRPYFSWPSFIPICFELTILFAAFAAFFGMLTANGFPRPYHPVFNAKNFERATKDGFFLCVAAEDKIFELEKTRSILKSFNPKEVSEVYP